MQGLELTIPNPDKTEVMSLAADYRSQGMNKSKALKKAWTDILGDDYDDDYGDDDDLYPVKKRQSNPKAESSLGTIGFVALAGYLIWCGIKYSQTKIWSWTPWKTVTPVSRRISMPTRIIASQQQRMATVSSSLRSVVPVHSASDITGENVVLIVP